MTKKILIVDDDKELCAEMSEILRGQGYEVRVALDGQSGWDLVRHDRFDIVLLDIKLPGMSGMEVLRNIKALKGNPPKVLVVSASPFIDRILDSEIELGKAGYENLRSLADGMISKPPDVKVLLDAIKKLLS